MKLAHPKRKSCCPVCFVFCVYLWLEPVCSWFGLSHAVAGEREGTRGAELERDPALPGEALRCARGSQNLLHGPSIRWGTRLLFPQLILEAWASTALPPILAAPATSSLIQIIGQNDWDTSYCLC